MVKLPLTNCKLLKKESFINGTWTQGTLNQTFSVFDPATKNPIESVYEMGQQEAKEAVRAAHIAFKSWKLTTPHHRSGLLLRWLELIEKNQDDLSQILTKEQGKPLEHAMHEIMGCRSHLTWAAEQAKRIHGNTLSSPDPSRRFMTLKQPMGVVSIITPWNFPLVLAIQKCAPALAAGCTIILKPSEETPLTSLALGQLAEEAGFPKGVVNVIACSDPKACGEVLTTSPLVSKITFTGSTDIGKQIGMKASQHGKNIGLEMGGNCPAIIFDDAPINHTLDQTFWTKFYIAGQVCNNINRFLIHEKIADEFINKFIHKAQEWLHVGHGLEKGINMGPMINNQGLEKVARLVKSAKAQGGKCELGGAPLDHLGPLFFAPTVLSNLNREMPLFKEEIFGPVAAFYTFSSTEEAVALANASEYGLAGYVFSSDLYKAWEVAEALEVGSCGINTCDVASELLPFGGWKESGVGRENGLHSLDSFLEEKTLVIKDTCEEKLHHRLLKNLQGKSVVS